MKNLIIIALFFGCITYKAQNTNVKLTNNTINAWYESPKESSGDTIVFRLNKFTPGPGDDPAFAFCNLTFKNNSDFSISYWRWATKNESSNEGKWNYSNPTTIFLDFGHQKSKCTLTILESKIDKLRVFIKEQ